MATSHSSDSPVYQPMALPARRNVSTTAPQRWLREGWRYLVQAKTVSLVYGGLFGGIGMLITWLSMTSPQMILTFWSGFLLVGPLFAVGLFRVARQMDLGEPIRLVTCYRVLRDNLGNAALFVLLLTLVMIAWVRFSTLAAALYVGNVTGTADFIAAMATPEGIGFVAVLFGVGAVFAALMFALTAWSLPMVVDGRTGFGTAIATSVKTVTEQPLPMLAWAGTVAALTVVGMLTFFAAFVVIFPWLGYATWAAYKDVFAQD